MNFENRQSSSTGKKKTTFFILPVIVSSIVLVFAALSISPTASLFAQGIGTQVFLPVVTNLSATEPTIELDVEGIEAQLTSLTADEDELAALGNDIGCVNPAYWYGYLYFQYVQRGDKGNNVWLAQYWLKQYHNRSLAVDGDFGGITYNAIREVQQYWYNAGYTACGRTIGVDGTVGAQTWAILAYKRTPPQGSGSGGGTRAQLAQQILDSNRISLNQFHFSGVVDNATAYQEMVDTAAGRQATLSSYGNAPGGSVYLGSGFLQHMLTLANSYSYNVSELAGGSHSRTSYHYAGNTVDVNAINGISVSSNNPYYQSFMQSCRNLGAVEVLGPGDANHSGHIHCSWGR